MRMPQTLTVTEHFQLGRFGEVLCRPAAGCRSRPTSSRPGAPANALQAPTTSTRSSSTTRCRTQNPDPIVFGRGGQPLGASNTLRGGDTVTGPVGVMTYTWGGNAASPNAYRLRPGRRAGRRRATSSRQPAARRAAGRRRARCGWPASTCSTSSTLHQRLHAAARRRVDRLPRRRRPRPSSTASGPRPSRRSSASTPTSSASARSRTTATARPARSSPRRHAQRGDGAGHLRVHRRRRGDRARSTRSAPTRSRSGMLYKPAKVTPIGNRGAEHRRVRQRRRRGAANRPSLAQAFARTRPAGAFIVDRQPPQDQGQRLRRAGHRRRPGQLRRRPHRTRRTRSLPGSAATRPAPATRTCSSSATSTPTPRRTRSRRSRRPASPT